ncbi:MAG: F0F1 ATP synthase subunit delta [Chloroflexi bacterium]|nr:F0F1 ATP synthase subunit delta [Chloroflexota bacterium]
MLEIDLATLAFQVLNFLALTALLYYVLFRPVMRRVEAHAKERAALVSQMQRERDDAAALRQDLEARTKRLDEDADRMMSEALNRIHAERGRLMAEAETEVERILAEAHLDARGIRRQMIDEFHDDLLDTILSVSGHVIRETAERDIHDQMLQALVDRVWKLGQTEMQQVENLRRSLGQRTPVADVATAYPLTPEQTAQLTRTFSALADRDVELTVAVEPDLLLGATVRLGDLVIDHSTAHKLHGLRGEIETLLKSESTVPA